MDTIYSLAVEYNDLYDALMNTADTETGEVDVDIFAAIANVQGAFEEKAIATATVFRKIDAQVDMIGAEIERLTAMKRHAERARDRVKDYLSQACKMTGTERIDGVSARISFRKSERTVIDDESVLPKEFVKVKTTTAPDLTAIKEAIKAGKEVDGAHLETVRNIQIK